MKLTGNLIVLSKWSSCGWSFLFFISEGVVAVEQKEYERIAKLEVHLQTMNAAVKRIEEKLDYNQKNYMQRTEIDEMFKFRDREIRDLKQAQEKLESNKKANISMWISGLSLAVLLLFNILNFLK
ncbi:hypothetical protein V4W76_10760 [Bacillus thuringiensis]|nr:hypothetical protein [Bacillus cereus]